RCVPRQSGGRVRSRAARGRSPARARGARHRGGEHGRPAPEVRPVGRLRRLVGGEQRRAIDVALERGDTPERDGRVADARVRQRRLEVADLHPAVLSPRGDGAIESAGRLMPAEESMEEMVRQTDQLINFTREVNRRIADSGISGVEGMVALYDQLRGALAKVTPQELEWAQGEVTRVLETLRRLSDELSHLAALKAVLDKGH